MKNITLWLVKNLAKNEAGRKAIYKELHNATETEYSEQTLNGNLYNAALEFVETSKVNTKNNKKSVIALMAGAGEDAIPNE